MSQPSRHKGSISRLLGEAVDGAAGRVEGIIDRLPGGRSERVIKRYANRKLYDTSTGAYTTLARLEELVRDGVDVKVIDHETGDDLTQETLGQIADRVARSDRDSGPVLSSLIRSPGLVAQAIEADEETKQELLELREQVAQLTELVGQLVADKADKAATSPRPRPKRRPTS